LKYVEMYVTYTHAHKYPADTQNWPIHDRV